MTSPIAWFDSRGLSVQLIILAAVCDPLGAAAGYVLAPSFGVRPFLGLALGLVVASVPLSVQVLRHARDSAGAGDPDPLR
ncbi:MAG: hypothetical protein ABEH56_00215 [Salinirussus sp.]